MDKKTAKLLDKYYTKPEIAAVCSELFSQFIAKDVLIVEPSAGSGSFIKGCARPIAGFDLYPENPDVTRHDFINDDLADVLDLTSYEVAFLGNPPFGRKGDLAVDFINKALTYGKTVGFILPIQFRKWSAQKRIIPAAKLVMDYDLPEDAFTFCDAPYDLRCSFQVWTIDDFDTPDLRIRTSPPTNHPDFEMWQFNRTDEALKYFDYDWDFAVPRQGYNDYSFKAFDQSECDRKKQWIFFKAKTEDAAVRLLDLDFVSLSKLNSGIPGFGKADVVNFYNKYNGK